MKNGRINPVIVVVAYNRENCMRRLLSALANAVYGDEVTLIISIDYGDNQPWQEDCKNFYGKFGMQGSCHEMHRLFHGIWGGNNF